MDSENLLNLLITKNSELLNRGKEKEKVIIDMDEIDFSFIDEI